MNLPASPGVLRSVVLTVALACGLAACGSPCSKHDGSVDGYCDGNSAVNCVTTCADCVDEWKTSYCTGTCSVGTTFPPQTEVGGSPPNMSDPAAWASCSEWEGDTGSS